MAPASGKAGSRPVEPPAIVTPTGIEARAPRVGHAAYDLVIAGCAILISCISLYIAVKQSRTMDRTLAATSWPLLQYESGNTDDQNKPVILMSINNAGVGPALVKRFRLVYNGKSYAQQYDFLADCCGYSVTSVDPTKVVAGVPLTSIVEGSVIRGGDAANYLTMPLASTNLAAWKKLDRARFKVTFDACYCSVLGDCWRSDLTGLEPRKVDECPPVKDQSAM